MQDLNDLFYFVQVVDHGGFAPAARALDMQKSKLSRRIAALEARLGVRLLNRSSRRFAVTEIGREYYTRCVAMLVEAEAADQWVAQMHDSPRGTVRMSCPTGLLSFQFGELIARFMATYPDVEVHLDATDRRVDVLAEGFDLAIRVRFPPLEPSDLVMRTLGESTQIMVAAPKLVPAPLASPADLTGLPSMDFAPARRDHSWTLYACDEPGAVDGYGQSVRVPHRPRFLSDHINVLRDAALAGVGVAQLPTRLVAQDLAEGRLISVLPNWRPRAGLIHAVFPSRRGLLPSVRTLIDFLVAGCREVDGEGDFIAG